MQGTHFFCSCGSSYIANPCQTQSQKIVLVVFFSVWGKKSAICEKWNDVLLIKRINHTRNMVYKGLLDFTTSPVPNFFRN